MNGDVFYLLLLCLVSGFTQAVLLCLSIFMLRHHRTYLFQRLFAVVLIMHSFGFFNNFLVATSWNLPCSEYLNSLLIFYDYVIVGGYMMFAVSLIFPNRYNIWQLLLIELPFVAAMTLFAVTDNSLIYPIIQIFTLTTSTILLIYLEHSIKKNTEMLENNVGDLEYFDLRWSSILLIVLFAIQLLWAFESLSQKTWFSTSSTEQNLLFDTLYCILTIVFALFITRKIIQQKVFSLSAEEEKDEITTESENTEEKLANDATHAPYHEILLSKNIEEIIRENQYYLDGDMTLKKLSNLLGTNRQYLSNYINQEKHKTFYEYINDFRLEKAKNLLETDSSVLSYSIEEIAALSGFNSYATFLRSFKKKYGQSPTDYLKNRK